ncbi:MAG: aryl-sulfate sulfotransferase [Rhodospirillales bacterium]|nr:aryl-sulfate sulfotransferase [Rhodospirillales bacterium]
MNHPLPGWGDSPVDQVTWRRVAKTGLTAYNPEKACDGYTLFCPLNETNAAILIDMEGNEVHRWQLDCQPGNYGVILPNGNLFLNAKIRDDLWNWTPTYSLFKGGALREYDWDGNIVWEHIDLHHHHDGRRLPHGGAIYLSMEQLTEAQAAKVKGGGPPTAHMLADVVKEVDAGGNLLWEWHAAEHLDTDIDILPDSVNRWEWTHLNAALPLDDDRILMSSRQLSRLFIIDKASGKVLDRFGPGPFYGQHDPHPLPNGNLLIFDNGSYRGLGSGAISYSRVIEFDMARREVVWEYKDMPVFNFQSAFISGAEVLPNGNILIAEGAKGRIFQITREGEVVWEYINPYFDENGIGWIWNSVQEAKLYPKDRFPALK